MQHVPLQRPRKSLESLFSTSVICYSSYLTRAYHKSSSEQIVRRPLQSQFIFPKVSFESTKIFSFRPKSAFPSISSPLQHFSPALSQNFIIRPISVPQTGQILSYSSTEAILTYKVSFPVASPQALTRPPTVMSSTVARTYLRFVRAGWARIALVKMPTFVPTSPMVETMVFGETGPSWIYLPEVFCL